MIDIEKLRKIAETRHVGLSYNYTPRPYMEAAAEHFPALLDELDHLRKRIEVLEKVVAIAAQTHIAGDHMEWCDSFDGSLPCDCFHEPLREALMEAANDN